MKNALLLLLLCATLGRAVPALANGPELEFTKTIHREFATTPTGMTALYNRFGKVSVNTWNENRVKIDITIVVNAGDQRNADKTFNRININFTNTAGYVKAETFIDNEGSFNFLGSNNNCQDFKINYQVWMPVGNQLDLRHKYGNAYVGNLNGFMMADIKYGDLRAETINNDAELIIGYGKANLAKVNNVKGQVSYGGIALGDANDVQIDSKYSELRFEKARNVRVTSKYDDLSLGTLDALRLQTKYANVRVNAANAAMMTAQYTDVKFANVAQTLDADLSYGSLKIDQLGRGFSSVNVMAKYTDVQMHVQPGAAYRFEAEGTHSGIKTPQGAVTRHEQDQNRTRVSGYVGGDANARPLIRTLVSYGGVKMQ
jgi:hypothetical protein